MFVKFSDFFLLISLSFLDPSPATRSWDTLCMLHQGRFMTGMGGERQTDRQTDKWERERERKREKKGRVIS